VRFDRAKIEAFEDRCFEADSFATAQNRVVLRQTCQARFPSFESMPHSRLLEVLERARVALIFEKDREQEC
jgi:hypothetical protein